MMMMMIYTKKFAISYRQLELITLYPEFPAEQDSSVFESRKKITAFAKRNRINKQKTVRTV